MHLQSMLLSASGVVVPSVAYQTSAADIAINATTKTFAAQPIGPAKATRYVVVGVTGTGVNGFSVSSLSVQAIAATKVIESVGATRGFASMWIVAVPTGTTGDVVINWSGTVGRAAIGVWAVYDIASATAVATNSTSGTATTETLSVNVSATGVAIGIAYSNGDGGVPTPTWVGLAQRYSSSAALDLNTGADFTEGSVAETPRVVTMTLSIAGDRNSGVAASWL